MPPIVERCVRSVLRDNPGMDESRAWAICQAAHKKGILGSKSIANFEETCPECIDKLTTELMAIHKITKEKAKIRAIAIFQNLISDKDGR